MANENRDKCPECGIPVPDMPEDATYEEKLCDKCYEKNYETYEETGN